MKTHAITGFIGIIIACFLLAGCEVVVQQPEQMEKQNTITVAGKSELDAAPDKAEVFLRVEILAPAAKQAQDQNSQAMADVQNALKGLGISKADIETERYNLYERREWNHQTKKSEIVGWQLDHTIKVTTTDLDSVGKIAQTAVSAGANNIERISFGLSDKKELEIRDSALKKAVENARQKADAIADGLRVSIVKVVSVSETEVGFRPYYPAEIVRSAMAEESAPPIQPKDVAVSASVSVVYEIR